MTLQEAALLYAELGFRVFPAVPGSKRPMVKDWVNKASQDPEVIKRWWVRWPDANIAIATGHGHTVIDCDCKNVINGIASLADWQQIHGEIPPTWTVTTPSGGIHYYFRSARDFKNRVGVLPGVDVRSCGGYVIAPPSVIQGKRYMWQRFHPAAEAALPADLERLLTDKDYIPEGGRNDYLFKYGSRLQANGVPDKVLLHALEEENERICYPPLEPEEVRTIWNSIVHRYKKGDLFADPETIEAITAADLVDTDIPPVEWIVKNLLPVGLSILGAPPKYYKSYMALGLCVAVCQGLPFLGFETVRNSCLYFDLESTRRRPKERLKQILGAGKAPDNLYIVTGEQDPGTLGNGFEAVLDNQLEQHPDIKLVVIDVFQMIRAPARNNQSGYDRDYADFKALKRLADGHNVAILVLHHTRKMRDESDTYNMLSGSVGTLGAMDTALVILKDKREDERAKLYATGRDMDSRQLVIMFNKKLFQWQSLGDAEALEETERMNEYRNSSVTQTVKALLEGSGSWKGSATDLIAASDILPGVESILMDPREVGAFIMNHTEDFNREKIKITAGRVDKKRYYSMSYMS